MKKLFCQQKYSFNRVPSTVDFARGFERKCKVVGVKTDIEV